MLNSSIIQLKLWNILLRTAAVPGKREQRRLGARRGWHSLLLHFGATRHGTVRLHPARQAHPLRGRGDQGHGGRHAERSRCYPGTAYAWSVDSVDLESARWINMLDMLFYSKKEPFLRNCKIIVVQQVERSKTRETSLTVQICENK